jgi:phage-related holin
MRQKGRNGVLASLIRSLAPLQRACLFGELLYPVLILVVLVILGHQTGLIAPLG